MKLALIGVGSLVGLAIGCVVGYSVGWFKTPSLPEGAAFDSLDDLRRSMLTTDERDLKPDQNVSLRTIVQPDPSDLIIYRLKPNLSVKFQSVPVTTNSHGFRGPDIPVEKAAGVFRLALLGDSFTFGWGVEEPSTFARVIERELNQLLPNGPRVEVLNLGVPGYSSFQEVALLKDLGAKFQPDAVLVYYVENDIGLPFFVRNLAKPEELARDTEFADFRAEQRDTEHDSANAKLLKNLDPNRALRTLSEFAQERGIKTFVTINPGRRAEKDESKLWVLQRRPDLQLLRIRDEVKAIIDEKGYQHEELQLKGDPHPSALKHGIIGAVLAKKLHDALWMSAENGKS